MLRKDEHLRFQELITGIFALMETRRGRLRPVILALKMGQQKRVAQPWPSYLKETLTLVR